jgi:hypothetical protein
MPFNFTRIRVIFTRLLDTFVLTQFKHLKKWLNAKTKIKNSSIPEN